MVRALGRQDSETVVIAAPLREAARFHAITPRAIDQQSHLLIFDDIYHAAVNIRQEEVPDRFDLETGKIHTRRKKVFRFSIHFQGSVIRRGH